MLGFARRKPSESLPTICEDGLYVKVGQNHSDPAMYWLQRTVRELGVGWFIPASKRDTHELRILATRSHYHHRTIVIFADLYARNRHSHAPVDFYTKAIAFDERLPEAAIGARRVEGAIAFGTKFVADVLLALHEHVPWRKLEPNSALLSESEGYAEYPSCKGAA
jgi:hypothetical protein